jgi:hypothetical protein
MSPRPRVIIMIGPKKSFKIGFKIKFKSVKSRATIRTCFHSNEVREKPGRYFPKAKKETPFTIIEIIIFAMLFIYYNN